MGALRHLQVQRDDRGVVTVTLDSPGRPVNVISRGMREELTRIVDDVAGDASARMLVLRSAKEKGFAAGADLDEVRGLSSRKDADAFLDSGRQLGAKLRALPIPTLAILHGVCVGGGLELAMYCRLRLARDEPSTQLGLPETSLGLIPGWGGTQLLPAFVGAPRGAQLILNSELVAAYAAWWSRLVSFTLRAPTFDDDMERLIDQLLASRLGPERRIGRQGLFRRLGWAWSVGRLRRECHDASAENPAPYAALEAIDAGVRQGWETGLQAEREQFCRILFDARSRKLLNEFFESRQHSR